MFCLKSQNLSTALVRAYYINVRQGCSILTWRCLREELLQLSFLQPREYGKIEIRLKFAFTSFLLMPFQKPNPKLQRSLLLLLPLWVNWIIIWNYIQLLLEFEHINCALFFHAYLLEQMLSTVSSFTLTPPWHSLSSTRLCSSTKSPWGCHLSSFFRLQTPAGQKSGLEAPGSSPKPKRDGYKMINVHLSCPWGPEVNNSVPCSTLFPWVPIGNEL